MTIGAIFSAPMVFLTSCGKAQNTMCKLRNEAEYYHQYKMAMEYIDKGEWKAVDNKLVSIFQCDKKFAPAYAALAWARVHAYKANVDPNVQKVLWKETQDFLKKSLKYAKNDSQEFIGHVTAIRVYTYAKVDDWLDEAEDHFEDAIDLEDLKPQYLPYYKGKQAAYYYMAEAYFEANRFEDAKKLLKTVLNMAPSGKYIEKANKLFEKIQQIEMVSSRYSMGDIGKILAKKEKVTRVDLVRLLVDEINLPQLYLDKLGSNFRLYQVKFVPLDIQNNPYKEEILTILKLNIRGLKPQYNPYHKAYLFNPDKVVTRCELALVLEDIYAKLTKNPSIKRKYLNYSPAQNPFKDLPVYSGCFNAMMNAINLGWLTSDNGYVHPDNPVSGAELLQAVYKLRDMLHRTF